MSLPPRFHCPVVLASGAELALPAGVARHVQVLRLQPGDSIVLFGTPLQSPAGPEGEYAATILEMGRSAVQVQVGQRRATDREAARRVHLAIGMPANERMDWLVEKATELGAASVQALMTERTVVRLDGMRALKRAEHWLSIAIAACEQCGRNQVPAIAVVQPLRQWLTRLADADGNPGLRVLLTFRPDARPLPEVVGTTPQHVTVLAGPEGGLSPDEEQQALRLGFVPVHLGPRILRAETAALAALTLLA